MGVHLEVTEVKIRGYLDDDSFEDRSRYYLAASIHITGEIALFSTFLATETLRREDLRLAAIELKKLGVKKILAERHTVPGGRLIEDGHFAGWREYEVEKFERRSKCRLL